MISGYIKDSKKRIENIKKMQPSFKKLTGKKITPYGLLLSTFL